MLHDHLVIVGASLAGVHAAEGARREGFTGRITMIGAEVHPPYDRPPLSKEHLHGDEPKIVLLRELKHFSDSLDVDLRLGVEAIALDVSNRILTTTAGDISYGSLVIATGSAPIQLQTEGPTDRVVTVRTWDDAQRIAAALRDARHVVVIGGGLIGSEVAAAARRRGAEATLIVRETAPLARAFGQTIGEKMTRLHERHGVSVRLTTTVKALRASGDSALVDLADGSKLSADLVVLGIGSRPATAWLRDSGLRMGTDGSIVCDVTMQAASGVFAAGDVASWPNPSHGLLTREENWTNAMNQGERAGRNAVAEEPVPYVAVPYFWMDLYDHRFQFCGVADELHVEILSRDEEGDPDLVFFGDGAGQLVGVMGRDQGRLFSRVRRLVNQDGSYAAATAIVETLLSSAAKV
ncbi:NAD(P)/FAD-dependent oxidoreductase [Streptomyces fuscichromogenes]|uniref:Ferredoxin reductase n=1 Tax=Streptomyces fuscichromogenes TaxID=1324013 RepID=A0A917XME0_9ACTN|nr:FAD-dependent oxidoreductase [Streptomyces fuscichromogenes]GGN40227.1 ferredoxin reductase [Streptomyces fuscichromogenes]